MTHANAPASSPSRLLKLIAAAAVLSLALALCACSEAQEQTPSSQEAFDAAQIGDTVQRDTYEEPEPAPSEEPEPEPLEDTGFVVCVNPGHQRSADTSQEPIGPGSSETKYKVTGGTSSVNYGTPESEVTLAVGLKLRDELETRGVTVVMTRTTEDVRISNAERAQVANEAGADLFVSLHCDDTGESSTHGFLTLVPGSNQWTGPILAESQEAGRIIHDTCIAELGAYDRGVIERTDLTGLNWSEVPAIYLEMGLMSNPDEDALLCSDEYQQQLAVAIADGIMKYLEG